MPAITTIVAVAGVAAAVGGTVSAKRQASKQSAASKKQFKKTQAAALAKPPKADTGAAVELRRNDADRRRGRGSLAARRRAQTVGGLSAPSASAVGGL